MSLPLQKGYEWLAEERAPHHMVQAIKRIGIKEYDGDADNPIIMAWAKELGLKKYRHDATAWCGLFAAICMEKGGRPLEIPRDPLWALNWAMFGHLAGGGPMFGDVLVKNRFDAEKRIIGGHVGFYVGEDKSHFHVLGGNQDDAVKVVRIAKDAIVAIRRPAYVRPPANVRRIPLSVKGAIDNAKES